MARIMESLVVDHLSRAEQVLSVSTPAAAGIVRLKASDAMGIAEARLACSSLHKVPSILYSLCLKNDFFSNLRTVLWSTVVKTSRLFCYIEE